uniref:Uncharacterized protein n=1 Tax=Aegilops tauschii TaxID=37682 RepID=M8BAX6_AEGTA
MAPLLPVHQPIPHHKKAMAMAMPPWTISSLRRPGSHELRIGDAGGLDGRVLGRREAVEGDGGVGRGDAGQERPHSARVVRRLDDDDGDGEAASGQDFAKLATESLRTYAAPIEDLAKVQFQ